MESSKIEVSKETLPASVQITKRRLIEFAMMEKTEGRHQTMAGAMEQLILIGASDRGFYPARGGNDNAKQ